MGSLEAGSTCPIYRGASANSPGLSEVWPASCGGGAWARTGAKGGHKQHKINRPKSSRPGRKIIPDFSNFAIFFISIARVLKFPNKKEIKPVPAGRGPTLKRCRPAEKESLSVLGLFEISLIYTQSFFPLFIYKPQKICLIPAAASPPEGNLKGKGFVFIPMLKSWNDQRKTQQESEIKPNFS
jgi:hypothetical protein